ncbi:MAG: Cdc6/Cdc18 family protein, partial [Candidatus Woesearchaeota archaeon]
QSSYIPENIIHRDEEIKTVAGMLAPALKRDLPSNIFIYGKTGTGKTLTILKVTKQMQDIAEQQNIPLKVLYMNCKLKNIADTEYRLVAELARMMDVEVPKTGLPTSNIYDMFQEAADSSEQILILILDEIDQLVKKIGDGILYSLTRMNSDLKKSQIAIIGISNSLTFSEELEPRVKSSLSEEDMVFPPYNALQIQQILKNRAKLAFKEEVLEPGVIEKCSAFAARDHGDARRALDLLRVAAEVAEREGSGKVGIKHIDVAERKIEKDKVMDIVKSQPKQFQVTLYSILSVTKDDSSFYTGDVYESYKKVCSLCGLRPLTQRRISDIIVEFDTLGMINAQVMSKGRYGRTRRISLSVPPTVSPRLKKILEESLGLN